MKNNNTFEFIRIRGNYLILFEKISQIPFLVISIVASFFLVRKFDLQALLPVAFILLSPISRLVNYWTTYYTLTEEHLIIESGIFTKKRIEIPFSTITTVDFSQNILFQFFKVYRIKVDNASQTNEALNRSSVNLALKMGDAIRFKQIITAKGEPDEQAQKSQQAEEATPKIHANFSDFIKLGLIQSKYVYIVSILAFSGPLWSIFFPGMDTVFAGGLIVAAVFFVYLLSVGLSLAKTILTYYNFEIWTEEGNLKIQYGLLNKKSYSLAKDKINGILLKQNILMRLTRLYTAEIIVIGYGDQAEEGGTEKAIIFPIASYDKLKQIIGTILPEYNLEYEVCKPEPEALRYFFYSPEFVLAVILFAAAIIAAFISEIYLIIIPAVILLALAIAAMIMKYSNAGISVGSTNVILTSGAYHKRIAVIKTSSIESITASGSLLKRRNGCVSIKLGFIAPLRVGQIMSLNLPAGQFQLLQQVLRY